MFVGGMGAAIASLATLSHASTIGGVMSHFEELDRHQLQQIIGGNVMATIGPILSLVERFLPLIERFGGGGGRNMFAGLGEGRRSEGYRDGRGYEDGRGSRFGSLRGEAFRDGRQYEAERESQLA
jgi:bacteriocin-like protein